MTPPQPRPTRPPDGTVAQRLTDLQALVGRMRRAAEKLPTLGERQQASANAELVQWAHDELTEHLPDDDPTEGP